MKVLQASGKFEKKQSNKQSAIITEDQLWDCKVLGDQTPETLLNSLFYYYIGLCFALRGGEEHSRLRHKPGQIKLYEPNGGSSYLFYIENIDCLSSEAF